ncbi:MAG: hypothetical protein JWO05_1141 [Gemmatimonadetes bacterium]|nr:hypothetical protein [Gemmatimonadota bacterium]
MTTTVHLATPPVEVACCRDLALLAPKFRATLERVFAQMKAKGHDPVVAETLRTRDRQRFLYGFGRTYDDGRGVVTMSPDAMATWHGFGLAVDVISASMEWNAPESFWRDLRELATAAGLTSGDDWDRDGVAAGPDPDERFSDRPHVQWGPPMKRSPSPRAAELYRTGGMTAVWAEVGAL